MSASGHAPLRGLTLLDVHNIFEQESLPMLTTEIL